MFTVEPRGASGGLALFFNEDIKPNILYSDNRIIDLNATFDGQNVYLTFIYGDPVVQYRHMVWDKLNQIGLSRFEPWLMIGDFNELTGNHEKQGGRLRAAKTFLDFNSMIHDCGMMEFWCIGDQLSWKGNRGTRDNKVRCKLDRAMGNEDWHSIYISSSVTYLPMIGSDHRPIVGDFSPYHVSYRRQFRFDKRWIGREGLQESVETGWNRTRNFRPVGLVDRIANCRNSISWWRKNNILPTQVTIQSLKVALEEANNDDTISQDEIRVISRKLQEAYRDEEVYWQQNSRNLWYKCWDQNTKYFHGTTQQRRELNRIIGIFNEANS